MCNQRKGLVQDSHHFHVTILGQSPDILVDIVCGLTLERGLGMILPWSIVLVTAMVHGDGHVSILLSRVCAG